MGRNVGTGGVSLAPTVATERLAARAAAAAAVAIAVETVAFFSRAPHDTQQHAAVAVPVVDGRRCCRYGPCVCACGSVRRRGVLRDQTAAVSAVVGSVRQQQRARKTRRPDRYDGIPVRCGPLLRDRFGPPSRVKSTRAVRRHSAPVRSRSGPERRRRRKSAHTK